MDQHNPLHRKDEAVAFVNARRAEYGEQPLDPGFVDTLSTDHAERLKSRYEVIGQINARRSEYGGETLPARDAETLSTDDLRVMLTDLDDNEKHWQHLSEKGELLDRLNAHRDAVGAKPFTVRDMEDTTIGDLSTMVAVADHIGRARERMNEPSPDADKPTFKVNPDMGPYNQGYPGPDKEQVAKEREYTAKVIDTLNEDGVDAALVVVNEESSDIEHSDRVRSEDWTPIPTELIRALPDDTTVKRNDAGKFVQTPRAQNPGGFLPKKSRRRQRHPWKKKKER